MGRLFGTDGVRGVANTELTCEMSMMIGRAAAMMLEKYGSHRPKIIIGKDTRISSDMLEAALAAGICSVGADAILLGIVPTPTVAYLVKDMGADVGIMISASHNPAQYNGIKIFNKDGYKLSDSLEEEIEAIILDNSQQPPQMISADVGRVIYDFKAVDKYIKFIKKSISGDFGGLKVAIDCANGSASMTADRIFGGTGAECIFINDKPNGININDKCGSTHMDELALTVKKYKCNIGVAFDGDADRCLVIDEAGEIIDGDKMIAIFAKEFKAKGRLKNNTAVVTTLTNMGFNSFAKREDIEVKATNVGDRYVLEEMLKGDYVIGGEQSGHIIFLDHITTGDGQLSAIKLLEILKNSEQKASKLASIMERFPQVMINVKVENEGKQRLHNDINVKTAIDKATTILGQEGRILVRSSGTEPLIRVMVEGRDFDQINKIAVEVADIIKERLC
jgi:phosphoglucosamine mutase